MPETEWVGRLLGLLELYTDDIAGERDAVLDYIDAFIEATKEDE